MSTFLKVDGLTWKIWLDSPDEPRVGGIYLFEDRAAADAYLAGPIVARLRANHAKHPEAHGKHTDVRGKRPVCTANAPFAQRTPAAEQMPANFCLSPSGDRIA